MNNDLFEDLKRFRMWCKSMGCHNRPCSKEVAERSERRMKEFYRLGFDLYNPDEYWVYEHVERQSEKGNKQSSMRIEMDDLGRWCRYRVSRGDLEFEQFEAKLPKFHEKKGIIQRIPTPDEVNQLLEAVEEDAELSEDENRRRALIRNIILIMAYGGPRIGEVRKIDLEDLRHDGILIRSEKGEDDRTIVLPGFVMSSINEYVERYRLNSDPRALFTSERGRISYGKTRRDLKDAGRAAGLPWFHSHLLRHFHCTMLLRGKVPYDKVQRQLGHKDPRTTQGYAHLLDEEYRNDISEFFDRMGNKFFLAEAVLI